MEETITNELTEALKSPKFMLQTRRLLQCWVGEQVTRFIFIEEKNKK